MNTPHDSAAAHRLEAGATNDADLLAVRDLLESLLALQTDLHAALREKLAAMKCADTAAMQRGAACEAALVEQFNLLELQRHALLGRLSVRWGRPAGAELRMRDVIAAAPRPMATQLESLAGSLRERMLAVADANRVVALATEAMTEHFRIVFEAFAHAVGAPAGYSRAGRTESAACGAGFQPEARILDAIG